MQGVKSLNYKIIIPILTICFGLLQGCGLNIKNGSLIVPNDPIPNGTSLDSATFSAASGQSDVTGFTTIYLLSPQNYIVRLDSISFPAETTLQMNIVTSAGSFVRSLRSNFGSQNYSLNIVGPQPTWIRIEIREPGAQQNYAIAIF